ncbi:MAG: cupin domain-containing protein [bacterium]|nr:MAG: cupin domain-containing protein [bacterium]
MEGSKIGDRIRNFREIKRLSREELAERSKLEIGFIQQVEDNTVTPALGTLLKFSRAMGIRLANFLDASVSRDPIVVRSSDRDVAGKTELSSEIGVPSSLIFHHLAQGKIDRHMEPFYIEVLPKPPGQVKVSQHEGEEFIAVLSGEVELQYGKDTFKLGQGDSAYYSSDVAHRIVALNEEKAEIFAVIYFHS